MAAPGPGAGERYPVFYARSVRRWRLFAGSFCGLLVIGCCLTAMTAASLLSEAPLHPPPLTQTANAAPAAPPPASVQLPCCGQIRGGFYVNWDKEALRSVEDHSNDMNVIFPEWFFLGAEAGEITSTIDLPALELMQLRQLRILPMLSNYRGGSWPTAALLRMIRSPELRQRFLDNLLSILEEHRLGGLNLDFENIPKAAQAEVLSFQEQLYSELHARGLLLTRDIGGDMANLDLHRVAAHADYLILMAYDEHDETSLPGPIASPDWARSMVHRFAAAVPANKVILGLPAYGYDWPEGQAASGVSFRRAMALARQHHAALSFDSASSHLRFHYLDAKGRAHTVYLADAATDFNLMRTEAELHVAGMAVWRLGGEDPRLWSFYKQDFSQQELLGKTLDRSLLQELKPDQHAQLEGSGDIAELAQDRHQGRVRLGWDEAALRITSERFEELPARLSFQLSGAAAAKTLALTFDDGPSEAYTPRILDTLAKEGVHATFFVVGEQALGHTELVRRMYAEGHEIGNHSFTHPDFAAISTTRQHLELVATRRIVEALTGHSPLLFRNPFGAHDESINFTESPGTDTAARTGYLIVNIGLDPRDWEEGTSAAGLLQRLQGKDGSMLLLHDAGGDRQATVAALPRLIAEFRARGYRFTTVSELFGKQRADVMPPLPTSFERDLAATNGLLLSLMTNGRGLLQGLFLASIVLMLLRTLATCSLAVVQRRREAAASDDAGLGASTTVSVIVPAYNEELNAVAVIDHILRSDHPSFDVIFVDDGSTDATLERVKAAYSGHSQVRILHKSNGGKASALNAGLRLASSEIVICIDADTRLSPTAITQLLREFRSDGIAAVAGHVAIANQVNMLTRWQSLEYSVSQSIDRRAFALLNGILTVPGAIGAARRHAVLQAGSYTSDTLAEDCDMTLTLLRRGHRITYAPRAVAMTEAPETLPMFVRQRFRWSFGIMQNLWKHRRAFLDKSAGIPGVLGLVTLPQTLLFQFVLPLLAPLADSALLLSLSFGWSSKVLAYGLGFFALDLGVTLFGLRLAGERRHPFRLCLLLVSQRLAYRYIVFVPLFKALLAAIRGQLVGWGYQQRQGRVAQITVEHPRTDGRLPSS